ncbi:MAG: DinB family protein, partial [Chloroflexi bacterium]|nr:DinB family protein [Chloroflexota bacterium]
MSEDIEQRRERYLQMMQEHGVKPHDQISESVRETQQKLLGVFSSASETQAARKPADDEWSLHELALHTVFTERLIAKLIHHTARSSTPPAEALEGAGIGMMPKDDDRPYEAV